MISSMIFIVKISSFIIYKGKIIVIIYKMIVVM